MKRQTPQFNISFFLKLTKNSNIMHILFKKKNIENGGINVSKRGVQM